jgi:acyl-CoA thioesterase-1
MPFLRSVALRSMLLSVGLLLASAVPAAATPAAKPAPAILVVGDSISAGYGLAADEGWVALLQRRLKSQGYGYRVVNASVSGETTTGGLARLPRALAVHRPQVVVIELGGNDGLRGLPLETSRANLERMIVLSKEAGARVLLLGMKIPPNYGAKYSRGFEKVFSDLARRHKLAFEPFFLSKIALEPGMIQADGLHPTAKAQPAMLDTMWPALAPLLAR